MATLKSKKLKEALLKAQLVGLAEESVTVDGCNLVLRSLPQKDYESIVVETQDFENIEYFHAYQMGHVCRSIVEIEGVDLRDADFIEDDVPAGQYLLNATCSKSKANDAKEALKALGIDLAVVPPDGSEGERTVLVERHEWIRQRASKWSREAISVLYRKFADVVGEGERRARDKVEFKTPDETAEDKYRRLLSEFKEIEGQLPGDLTKKILEDAGYLQKSTAEELEEIARRAREFAIEQAKLKEQVVTSVPEPAPSLTTPPQRPAQAPRQYVASQLPPEEEVQQPVQNLQDELMERLKNRQPLNRVAMQAPVPMGASQESRAAQIAALEGTVDPDMVAHVPQPYPNQIEVPELSRHAPQLDGKSVKGLIDKPPAVGLNPRFRRQP